LHTLAVIGVVTPAVAFVEHVGIGQRVLATARETGAETAKAGVLGFHHLLPSRLEIGVKANRYWTPQIVFPTIQMTQSIHENKRLSATTMAIIPAKPATHATWEAPKPQPNQNGCLPRMSGFAALVIRPPPLSGTTGSNR
jgi:hypothetical protein